MSTMQAMTAERARQSWTPAQDDRLRDLYLVRGYDKSRVAAEMGRTESSVLSRMQRLGMLFYHGGPMRTGETGDMVRADKASAAGRWIRCLGVGSREREHSFLSEDPRYNRVCGACRRKARAEMLD